MNPPFIERFEERCAAAKLAPADVLRAARVSPSLWWKWRAGKVSPTLRSFEACILKLNELGGDFCDCGGKPKRNGKTRS